MPGCAIHDRADNTFIGSESRVRQPPGASRSVTPCEHEEYSALRATIRERGTARPWLAFRGVASWAALVVATTALAMPPVGAIVPLAVLAAAFEGVFALHI